MMSDVFASDQDSHKHSLITLQALYEYDDFMSSVQTLVDMGCGSGLDLEWWATRTTRDESRTPLNIRCVGIDTRDQLPIAHRYRNITYQQQDFETEPIRINKRTFDVIWCHNSWQFVIDPFRVLRQWRDCLSENGMLVVIVPQTTNIQWRSQAFDQRDFCYHHWSLVSLIHVLAVSGFDCHGGYFLKNPDDVWLHAVVYRGTIEPQDPRRTSWYELSDLGLLPDSVMTGVRKHGYARQRDLVLPWLDRSVRSYRDH